MRAIRHHSFGPPDVLRLEEVRDVHAGPGQVRIGVGTAGVHRLDTAIRAGEWQPAPTLPMVPGREVAGVVDEVGAGVDPRWLGRRVVAHLGPGASGGYAELVAVDAGRLHEIPDGMEAATAVGAIGTGRTAAGILDLAQVRADGVVVVTSAAGGLGLLLVQGARNAGARVVGLAGGAKLDLIRRHGADTAIDYRRDGWADVLREAEPRLTLLLDGLGGDLPRRLHAMLESGGRTVRFSGDRTGYEAPDRPVRDVLGRALQSRIPELEKAALEAAADGSRVPHVGTVLPLERAADAHRALEDRTAVGKVVLVVGR